MNPLILAPPERFQAVRELLQAAGYTTRQVCDRLDIGSFDECVVKRPEREPAPVRTALELLIALFFEGGVVSKAGLASFLGSTACDDLSALGLIEPFGSSAYFATVAMYPVEDLFICSDRFAGPEGAAIELFPDIVFSARSPATQRFLRAVPVNRCDSLLDLCSGTGVFALIHAAQARQAYAFDIAPRSTHFAEFNRRLNGIENVICATGDLYEPAGDLTFDKIIAHPPYVPVLEQKFIFSGGGNDGEAVVQRVVADLPGRLRPGGRLYCGAAGSDRVDAPFESRIREWLGPAENEFDVALVVRSISDPRTHAISSVIREKGDRAELLQWEKLFQSKKIERIVYGKIVIQRHTEARPPFTVRRQMGPAFSRHELEWLLDWESAAARPNALRAILAAPLRATAHAELHTCHQIQEGEWTPSSHSLQSAYPFESRSEIPGWMAVAVGRARGQTALELLRELQHEQVLHPQTPPEEFADALTVLLSGGFLESGVCPLPKQAGAASAPQTL